MDTKEYTIYTSFLDDLNNRNEVNHYQAINFEYCSATFTTKATDESEALEAFYNSAEYHLFVSKHSHPNIFVLTEGETIYRKVRKINNLTTNTDD